MLLLLFLKKKNLQLLLSPLFRRLGCYSQIPLLAAQPDVQGLSCRAPNLKVAGWRRWFQILRAPNDFEREISWLSVQIEPLQSVR
jgi:hypothetical protein